MPMMDVALNAWLLFHPAMRQAADVSAVFADGTGVQYTYRYDNFARRAQQLMHALDRMGLDRGAVVGTLAWNNQRHFEAYFGVPCSGRILHTLNPRLSIEDLAYIINRGRDQVLLVDPDFLPLVEKLTGSIPSVRHTIVLAGAKPAGAPAGVILYDDLIADCPESYPEPEIEERSPLAICFTSGTTGRPKGVVYTHRSAVLQALAISSGAGAAVGPMDSVLSQVPMFHANGFAIPHTAVAVGAKQIFYAGPLNVETFVDLLIDQRVTISAGVPTIWHDVSRELDRRSGALPDLRHIITGGSQPPRTLIERYADDFGVQLVQAWGMTETSPLGAVAWPKEYMRSWESADLTDKVRAKAGMPLPCISISIRDDSGRELPWDGATVGQLWVRGPWVADSYLDGESPEKFTNDGWFATDDAAVGSPEGYFVIKDRRGDLIKSGGEWISSVEMENALSAMDTVKEAAVIAIPDDRWLERPLPCLVPTPGDRPSIDEIRAQLASAGFPGWQLPASVQILDELPRTSVGKVDKKALRSRYGKSPSEPGVS